MEHLPLFVLVEPQLQLATRWQMIQGNVVACSCKRGIEIADKNAKDLAFSGLKRRVKYELAIFFEWGSQTNKLVDTSCSCFDF